MRRSPAYIETPQIRLPPAVNISHQNIRRVHSEHTQNFIYPSLKCKWQIHTKLLAPNDLISLSYRTQYCVWSNNVYYELKKNRLKYLSATWPVLEDFLGLLKVSLSRHNKLPNKGIHILWLQSSNSNGISRPWYPFYSSKNAHKFSHWIVQLMIM